MSKRLTRRISQRAAAILFSIEEAREARKLLDTYLTIDLAHQIMLREQGIVATESSTRLISGLLSIQSDIADDLIGEAAPRGLYLLYEEHIGSKLGTDLSGLLQTARSRNDLSATARRLIMREPVYRAQLALIRLGLSTLRIARRRGNIVMPIYTHFQPALPIYFGQYLHAVVLSITRSLDQLYEIEAELDLCPLGAGSIAGTSLPIMPSRSANLLGFRDCLRSSIDAVASRDTFLRLLAELSVIATSLSRVSADLQLWTTNEFGLFDVDDSAAGGSSMMPQKKNIYFLEHVKGKSASLVSKLTGALTAVHATPFTNSIAVGTEAMKHVGPAIDELINSVTLLRIVVEHSVLNEPRAREILATGFTNATALAEMFVNQGLYTFRQAHNRVGEIVKSAYESGITTLEQAIEAGLLSEEEEPVGRAFADLVSFKPAQHGLVLSERMFDVEFRALRIELHEHYLRLRVNRRRQREAGLTLERTAAIIAQEAP